MANRTAPAATLDLAGWRLTDDAADPSKYIFPPGSTLAPGEYRVIYASKRNSTDPAEWHIPTFKNAETGKGSVNNI